MYSKNFVEITESHSNFSTGPHELLHCIEHPHEGQGEIIYREQLPLLEERVEKQAGQVRHSEAIGLYFVEELSAEIVLYYTCTYFVATFVFGIVWWRLNGSLRDAFTASSFFFGFLSNVTLVLTISMYQTG